MEKEGVKLFRVYKHHEGIRYFTLFFYRDVTHYEKKATPIWKVFYIQLDRGKCRRLTCWGRSINDFEDVFKLV